MSIITIIFFTLIAFSYISSFITNENICKGKGGKLYETNLEIKNDLLKLHNYNYKSIQKFLTSYFNQIKKSSDSYSISTLDSQYNILLDSLKCNRLFRHVTKIQSESHDKFLKELSTYKRMYKLQYYTEQVFYYHHGLRFASKNVKDYILNKYVIDVGSCIGDSLMILQSYTTKAIHLYEFSKINLKKLKKNIEINKITSNKYIIHEKGLSNFTGSINISDSGNGGVGIGKGNLNNITVNINTLDNEFIDCKCKIGFIKVDIEGQGFNFILGGKNIIAHHRPVMSIAIYHNFDEYFRTRYLLESFLLNYSYEYRQFNDCEPFACEFSLFAYPSELS